MTQETPQVSTETVLTALTGQAKARWGADYAEQNRELLQQAASYVVNIANNLPDAETEPGFFHSPNK